MKSIPEVVTREHNCAIYTDSDQQNDSLATAINQLAEVISKVDYAGGGVNGIEVEALAKINQLFGLMNKAELKIRTTPLEAEIVEVLQVSTAHLTQQEAEYLITQKRYLPNSRGYTHIAANDVSVYIALDEGEDDIDGASQGLKDVADYARDRGIGYIRFDRDAPSIAGCTTYNRNHEGEKDSDDPTWEA